MVELLQVMSLLLLKARLVQVFVLLLKALLKKALLKVALSLSLSRTPTPTPLTPGSPYDARPGISRFRGTLRKPL